MEGFTPTRYWHEFDDVRIQCDVGPWACKLRGGHRGVCFVRARQGVVDRTAGGWGPKRQPVVLGQVGRASRS